jgi:hypothetical protein
MNEPQATEITSMTLVLVGLAAVVFAVLAGVVHTVWQRRHHRRTRQQWEERERLLDRKP